MALSLDIEHKMDSNMGSINSNANEGDIFSNAILIHLRMIITEA